MTKYSQAKVANIAEINSRSYSLSEEWEFIIYLDTGNIVKNIVGDVQYIDTTKDDVPLRARRKVSENDIIYSTVRPSQQHYGFIKEHVKNMLVSTGFAVISVNERKAYPKFIYYCITQNKYTEKLQTIAEQNVSTYPTIKPSDLGNLAIPLPPLDVQKRIAGILGALDDRIDVLRRENVVLEQMAQAVFQSWFVDFDIVRAKAAGAPESEVREKYHITPELYALFPSALTPDNLPLGWEKKKLGDFLILSYGKALKENDRVSGSVPVYGSSGQIGTHNESLVKAPGIVVGRKGTVGSVIWCDYDFYPIDTVFYVQFLKEGVCWYFAYFLLKILKLQNLAGDSAVPGLNRDAAYAQTFVCPRTELLSSFEEVADVLFCKIKNNAEQIRTLSATRDALLPKLMNGEIEV